MALGKIGEGAIGSDIAKELNRLNLVLPQKIAAGFQFGTVRGES